MSISINVELTSEEIVLSCYGSDKKNLLKCLLEDMPQVDIEAVVQHSKRYVDDNRLFFISNFRDTRLHEMNFNDALLNLGAKYLSITIEDQNIIESISKKY